MDITKAVKPEVNELAIKVVNFRSNRSIGDAALLEVPAIHPHQPRKLTKGTKLMESGLLDPEVLEAQ